MSTKLDPIDHIAVTVANIEESIRWYQTSFGCDVVYSDIKIAVLQFANIKLVLTLPSEEPPHLGLVKDDAHTYGELRERPDGQTSTYVSDPTGNIVELLAVQEASNA